MGASPLLRPFLREIVKLPKNWPKIYLSFRGIGSKVSFSRPPKRTSLHETTSFDEYRKIGVVSAVD